MDENISTFSSKGLKDSKNNHFLYIIYFQWTSLYSWMSMDAENKSWWLFGILFQNILPCEINLMNLIVSFGAMLIFIKIMSIFVEISKRTMGFTVFFWTYDEKSWKTTTFYYPYFSNHFLNFKESAFEFVIQHIYH